MDIAIAPEAIEEFGLYEEVGVIVFGAAMKPGHAIDALILQIEDARSPLRAERQGIYVEIDDRGFFGGVRQFSYLESARRIELILDAARSNGIERISLRLPPASNAQDDLLRKLAASYYEKR